MISGAGGPVSHHLCVAEANGEALRDKPWLLGEVRPSDQQLGVLSKASRTKPPHHGPQGL